MLDRPPAPIRCLHEYLLRSLAEAPVHWPRTVHALVARCPRARCFVDYGPGGGSGAAKMSRQVIAEGRQAEPAAISLGPGSEIGEFQFQYYTQLVRPGQLPQSWLAWLKLET